MTKFICPKCKGKFANNRNLMRHREICVCGGSKTNRKKFKCQYCTNNFSRKDSLDRHIKMGRCEKYNDIKNKQKIKGNNNNNTNTTKGKAAPINNIIESPGSNIYNINFTFDFGKDGTKNISRSDLIEIIKSDDSIFESMIRNVNLNPNKPQHHNVFFGNLQSPYGEVYENKIWVKKKIDEMLDILIDAKREDLEEILNGRYFKQKSKK